MGGMQWRLFWPDILSELRTILATTEKGIEEARPGSRAGVWIETLGNNSPQAIESAEATDPSAELAKSIYLRDPRLRSRYHLDEPEVAQVKASDPLENIPVRFRAVNLGRFGDSAANSRLAFDIERAIQASPFFDPTGSKLSGDLEQVGRSELTFTFGMVLKLRTPQLLLARGK